MLAAFSYDIIRSNLKTKFVLLIMKFLNHI